MSTQARNLRDANRAIEYMAGRLDFWINEAQRLAWLVRTLGGDPDAAPCGVHAKRENAKRSRPKAADTVTANGRQAPLLHSPLPPRSSSDQEQRRHD